jgi:hypothetical protein
MDNDERRLRKIAGEQFWGNYLPRGNRSLFVVAVVLWKH